MLRPKYTGITKDLGKRTQKPPPPPPRVTFGPF